jgi:hypothetical protein
VINLNYPEPGVTMALNDGLGDYPGLDIFGRVINLSWTAGHSPSRSSSSSSSGPTALVNLGYGYDRVSNRTFRADAVAASYSQSMDEKYENDALNRLIKFHRGTLVNGVITNPGLQQGWKLDATDNWRNFTQFDPSNSGNTMDQERRSNPANEIIRIGGSVGARWQTPGYDRAGNMTTIPQPDSPALPYTGVFDAWHRLRFVIDASSSTPVTVQENQYDGRNFRVERISGGQATHAYYSSSWQVLEDRVLGSSSGSSGPPSLSSSSSSLQANLIPVLQNV